MRTRNRYLLTWAVALLAISPGRAPGNPAPVTGVPMALDVPGEPAVREPASRRDATLRWETLDPGETRPAPVASHAAICDRSGAMWVFGGLGLPLGVATGELWTLSPRGRAQWRKVETTGTAPGPRADHSLVYDPEGRRAILFGGIGPDESGRYGDLNDVWELRLGRHPDWTRLHPAGDSPKGRDSHSAVWDSKRERMIVYGGGTDEGLTGDVWALELSGAPRWVRLLPSEAGPLRGRHAAIYDLRRDRMLVFGGVTLYAALENSLWELRFDPAPVWTELHATGPVPAARAAGRQAVYDAAADRMLVYSGYENTPDTPFHTDLWALELDAAPPEWVPLAPLGDGPPPMAAGTVAIDGRRGSAVFFGGEMSAGVWSLRLDGPVSPRRRNPVARDNASSLRRLEVVASKLRVEYSSPDGGPAALEILDISGRRIAAARVSGGAGHHEFPTALARGLYFVRMRDSGHSSSTKIVIAP